MSFKPPLNSSTKNDGEGGISKKLEYVIRRWETVIAGVIISEGTGRVNAG